MRSFRHAAAGDDTGSGLWPFSRRPSPQRGERFIVAYEFPPHIERGVRRKHPQLTDDEWVTVESGLREWLVCCAWRGGATLAMPSRIVDDAWHQFLLDSVSYVDFCRQAYGEYLHHIPDEGVPSDAGERMTQTVHAWDRSRLGTKRGESVLWDLDENLAIPDPLGMPAEFRRAVRARYAAVGSGAAGDWMDGDPFDAGTTSGGGGCGGGG